MQTPVNNDNLYANLALERISRALRQEKRVQAAYKRLYKHQDELTLIPGKPMPRSWVKRRTALEDEIYFLIVATNHAISARQMMISRGHNDLPAVTSSAGLKAWRNVLEHWDDPGRGQPIRSLQNWATFNPTETHPGLTQGGHGYRLETMSGVNLDQLRDDLTQLKDAVGIIGKEAWGREWLTPAEAASIIGVPVDGLPPRAALDFSDIGEGPRYPRQWVELVRATGTPRDNGDDPYAV